MFIVGDLHVPLSLGVIVPTYNRADLLVSALDSLFLQSVPATEILVVDDGSTDHTPQTVARYPSITYLRQENRGKAAALNHGLALLQSDVVIVLDDDDVFPPSALERHCEALKRAPQADFSYGRFQRFWGESPQCAVHVEDELIQAQDSRRLVIRLLENCFLPNPTWAVRREALLRVGGYCEDLSFNEDYDVILRLARQNEGVFVDEVVLFQRKHEALRGPARERITIESPTQKWAHYDRLVLERLNRD